MICRLKCFEKFFKNNEAALLKRLRCLNKTEWDYRLSHFLRTSNCCSAGCATVSILNLTCVFLRSVTGKVNGNPSRNTDTLILSPGFLPLSTPVISVTLALSIAVISSFTLMPSTQAALLRLTPVTYIFPPATVGGYTQGRVIITGKLIS